MSNEVIKCEFCDTPVEITYKGGRKRRFCSDLCKVSWHYHNNPKYRESQLVAKADKYYEDRDAWMEKNRSYKKRDNWEGNLMSKGEKTSRRELYEVPPTKAELERMNAPKEEEVKVVKITDKFSKKFDFGDIDFGFNFDSEDGE